MTMTPKRTAVVALASAAAISATAAVAWAAAPEPEATSVETAAATAAPDEMRPGQQFLQELVDTDVITDEQRRQIEELAREKFAEKRAVRQDFRQQALEIVSDAHGMTPEEFTQALKDRTLEPLPSEQREAVRDQVRSLREDLGLRSHVDREGLEGLKERLRDRISGWLGSDGAEGTSPSADGSTA